MRHVWTNSLDALATEIVAADNSGDRLPRMRSLPRSQPAPNNALGARAFWLDVDAGEEAQKKNPDAYKDAIKPITSREIPWN